MIIRCIYLTVQLGFLVQVVSDSSKNPFEYDSLTIDVRINGKEEFCSFFMSQYLDTFLCLFFNVYLCPVFQPRLPLHT